MTFEPEFVHALPDEPYRTVAELFARFDRPWFLCGGWAVDGWLGSLTRDHGDVDVAVFDADQRALFEHLVGWELIPHDEILGGANTARWDGSDLTLPAHIHARGPGSDPAEVERLVTDASGDHSDDLNFEFIVNRLEGDDWIVHATWSEEGRATADDPTLAVPVARAIRTLPNGVPAVSPEVLLVLKCTTYRDDPAFPLAKTMSDARALAALLDPEAASWARAAMARLAPPHPFVESLPWRT